MINGKSGGMAGWQIDRFTRQCWEMEDLFRRVKKAKRRGLVLISMGND